MATTQKMTDHTKWQIRNLKSVYREAKHVNRNYAESWYGEVSDMMDRLEAEPRSLDLDTAYDALCAKLRTA